MKQLFPLVMAGLTLATPAMASPLTPSQALERAKIAGLTRGNSSPSLLMTRESETGEASMYIFDNPSGEGFLILSADDVANPILGYSDKGDFDVTSMPPQLEWWLSEYERMIEYARSNNLPAYNAVTRSERTAVAPLVETTWNQNSPYNNECPEINRRKAPTGCVATAMAQIMKRWNYPEKGSGTCSITNPATGRAETMLLDKNPFDWDNMLDSYSGAYTQEQANAVSNLMKACGYSVDMSYALKGSGALALNAAKALINNFKYNPNIQYCSREYYTATEWDNMIYNELVNGRPVLYGGQSTSVGHEFVCDGYNTDGYFHFNWGWGGMSDGYFTLDALNPDSVGTGGGDGGGFNIGQDIVIGIQPTATGKSGAIITQMGNLTITGKSGILEFSPDKGWYNMGLNEINVNLGFSIEPINGTAGNITYVLFGDKILPPPSIDKKEDGYYIGYDGWSGSQMKSLPAGLADGEYKITVCSQSRISDNEPWIPVLTAPGDYNYGIIIKKGSSITCKGLPSNDVVIKEGMPVSEMYYGCAVKFALTIENKSDIELTRGFYPNLYLDNNLQMTGEGIVVTLQPYESVTKEFTTVFNLVEKAAVPTVAKEYTLRFYDCMTTKDYDWSRKVTLKTNPGDVSVNVSEFKMPGLNSSLVATPHNGDQMVYDVMDKSVIPFSCEIKNTGNFFGYPVQTLIFPESLQGTNIESVQMGPTPTLSKDESATLEGILDFTDAESGAIYAAAVFTKGKVSEQVSNLIFFRIASSGVDEIDGEEGLGLTYDQVSGEVKALSDSDIVSIRVVSMSGMTEELQLAGNGNGCSASVSHLARGIYVLTAIDANGKSRSIKIAR